MLDKDDLESLKLFNEKTEKLTNYSFTKKIISDGFGLKISAKEDEPVNIETRFPPNESIEAFTLTLRFFIQNNEISSFRNLAKVYSNLPSYRDEKRAFFNTRDELNDFLDSPDKVLHIKVNGKEFSNREIYEIFIYGGLAHANKVKKKIYDEWMANPMLKPITEHAFINVMVGILQSILHVQELNDLLIIDFNCFRIF